MGERDCEREGKMGERDCERKRDEAEPKKQHTQASFAREQKVQECKCNPIFVSLRVGLLSRARAESVKIVT